MVRGLTRRYFEGRFTTVAEMLETTPRGTSTAPSPALSETEPEEFFGLEFRGSIRVPEDGVYTFHLGSDDGSRFWIGEDLVVDHDGLHGPTTRSGQVALAAGHHPMRVAFFQNGGGKALHLQVQAPGWSEPRDVPTEWLVMPR